MPRPRLPAPARPRADLPHVNRWYVYVGPGPFPGMTPSGAHTIGAIPSPSLLVPAPSPPVPVPLTLFLPPDMAPGTTREEAETVATMLRARGERRGLPPRDIAVVGCAEPAPRYAVEAWWKHNHRTVIGYTHNPSDAAQLQRRAFEFIRDNHSDLMPPVWVMRDMWAPVGADGLDLQVTRYVRSCDARGQGWRKLPIGCAVPTYPLPAHCWPVPDPDIARPVVGCPYWWENGSGHATIRARLDATIEGETRWDAGQFPFTMSTSAGIPAIRVREILRTYAERSGARFVHADEWLRLDGAYTPDGLAAVWETMRLTIHRVAFEKEEAYLRDHPEHRPAWWRAAALPPL